jgi:hypothetical protein
MKSEEIKTIDWYHYNALFFMEHILGYDRYQKYWGNHQKKLYHKIDKYLSGSDNREISAVDEVDKNMSGEEFMKICYEPGLPKVFRGAAKDWPAVGKWTLDFFEQNYGDVKITLNDNVGLADQKFEILSFGHYIRQLKAGSLKYLRFSDVVNDNESLKNDFDMTWLRRLYLPDSWGEDIKMFMGNKGSLTRLHVGFSDFLFVQVMGRKKWILYPTNNRLHLDARTERTHHFYSKADPYQTNDPDFPLLKYAQRYEVYLEPGDVLWVPSLVWHHVENLDDSIGIRCGRSSILSASKSSKMLTLLFFLATKPSLISHAINIRTKKRDLMFSKSWDELNESWYERINPFKKKKNP